MKMTTREEDAAYYFACLANIYNERADAIGPLSVTAIVRYAGECLKARPLRDPSEDPLAPVKLSGEMKDQEDLRRAIFTAVGEASMCWVDTPKGIFDSDHAHVVGERLFDEVMRLMR